MSYVLRTRIKREIVAEFILPVGRSNKVIILCGGMPGYPAKKELMFFLADKGYWVFLPRYRGTWESDGSFLKKSPHEDVIDVIDSLSSGFTDLWNNKRHKIKNPKIHLIGSSFGGPAVILASKDKRVKKAVAFSPVIDWRVETKLEPLDWMGKFTKSAFGNGYRFKQKDWDKLKSGKFYNPITEIKTLNKNKLYIIHAKDDEVVYANDSVKFAKELGCKITLLQKGGHLSTSMLLKAAFWKRVEEFLH
ncbi:MAG TPA: prolyl oligopeptidase family serine peptidase [Patescibacteria group bacterium]|nr:prolyl oligopeptidase family serine peptidase [Patescibacteria group bacterium]